MVYRWMRSGLLAALVAAPLSIPTLAIAQEDPAEDLQKQIQEFQKQLEQQLQMQLRNMPRGGAFGAVAQRPGRLGVRLEPPSEVLREQLNLPSDQGLVISEVVDGSVADKAGLRQYDILLEFDGKVVTPDPATFVKMVGNVKADGAIDIVVLRKGRKETIEAVKLPEAAKVADESPLRNGGGGFRILPIFPPNNFPNPVLGRTTSKSSSSIRIEDGQFTVVETLDGLKTTIKGRKVGDEFKPSSIEIVDGKTTVEAAALDEIPEKYRAAVARILRNLR